MKQRIETERKRLKVIEISWSEIESLTFLWFFTSQQFSNLPSCKFSCFIFFLIFILDLSAQ
jgi:hypothetical protein